LFSGESFEFWFVLFCFVLFVCGMTTQTATQQETSSSSQQTTQSTSQVKSDAITTALAQGLMNLIGPVVRECDERIQNVYKSQEELSNQIDSLSKGFFHIKAS
jgi:type III secretory pathway component EscV